MADLMSRINQDGPGDDGNIEKAWRGMNADKVVNDGSESDPSSSLVFYLGEGPLTFSSLNGTARRFILGFFLLTVVSGTKGSSGTTNLPFRGV